MGSGTPYAMASGLVLALVALSQIASIDAKGNAKQRDDAVTVAGLVVIKGLTYRATCNCPPHVQSLENMIHLSRGLCYPSKVKVRVHGPHDVEEYRLMYNAFHPLPHEDFINVDALPISSMDGRVAEKALYAPGGDLGIFIMSMLNQYDGVAIPDQEGITSLLRQYIRQVPNGRTFYHATDTKALDAIRKGLGWEIIDLTNIDPPHQKKVKDLIALGALGDPFMKFLVDSFHNVPAKRQLVLMCINAFFDVIWNKEDAVWEQLVLEVLEGDSAPAVVVELSVSKGCQIARLVPQVHAKAGNKQLLIYTEPAADHRKRDIATYLFNQHDPRQRKFPLDEVLQHLDKLVHTLMEEFVSRTVDNMRFYNFTFV